MFITRAAAIDECINKLDLMRSWSRWRQSLERGKFFWKLSFRDESMESMKEEIVMLSSRRGCSNVNGGTQRNSKQISDGFCHAFGNNLARKTSWQRRRFKILISMSWGSFHILSLSSSSSSSSIIGIESHFFHVYYIWLWHSHGSSILTSFKSCDQHLTQQRVTNIFRNMKY